MRAVVDTFVLERSGELTKKVELVNICCNCVWERRTYGRKMVRTGKIFSHFEVFQSAVISCSLLLQYPVLNTFNSKVSL